MKYKLNDKRALDKTIEATDRDHSCSMKFKEGSIVKTFNAEAYEILKSSINNTTNLKLERQAILLAKPILNATVHTNATVDNRVLCQRKSHYETTSSEHRQSNHDIDIHNHQPNSPYELMVIMAKDLTDPCCTHKNNQNNTISSLNDELIKSEPQTLSREDEETTNQICMVCRNVILNENTVGCLACGQGLHISVEGLSENSLNNHVDYIWSFCRIPYNESLHELQK
ncbi:unnamed protein product [Mytilus edulis]|uniref:Uncharacterized protein n=1 Tax=Mytilus edulis TaxID=6550 RepID=A0A8S3Q4C9_MYTED|nr:unnamed protein product [Mytilus edulis]